MLKGYRGRVGDGSVGVDGEGRSGIADDEGESSRNEAGFVEKEEMDCFDEMV